MEGPDKFREAFEAYSDNYVIIGGTACDIAMTGTAVRPRATHDIDINDVIKAPTAIVETIKDFVASIRSDWPSLSESLAKALDQDVAFVEGLLNQLDGLFINE